ncbi:MAG: uracil-DNA glycosylase [Acidimicrobiia bacterium]
MGNSVAELEELGRIASGCVLCPLSEGRTQVVFGEGSPTADLMFIGEAPGLHEDEQGLPFVGPAGQLLNQLLGEIGMKRSEVYIANVIKCRPPGNRDPRQEEVDACKDYLRRQLELIQPRVVVTLGNFSTKLLLKRDVGITRLRGQVYPWWGRYLVPTFHPAAALRSGEQVLDAIRYDLALARQALADPVQRGEPEAEGPQLGEAEQLGLFG